ncbi:MAG: Endoribonuclease YbeY [Gemmatimonadaceae bacterium]|nr:Endoribonuclease YbeY [Gemmatimonadaceae bacterium]
MSEQLPADRKSPNGSGVIVDTSATDVRAPLPRAAVRSLVRFVLRRSRVRSAVVSVAFVSNRRIAALNRRVFGRSGVTDVIALTFRKAAEAAPAVGDVYVAADVVRANARRARIGVREEAARVVVHGVLHVLGHDHPDTDREKSAMWRAQERHLLAAKREGVW